MKDIESTRPLKELLSAFYWAGGLTFGGIIAICLILRYKEEIDSFLYDLTTKLLGL